ncbi:MAG: pirin family protein [Desulfocapsaceae bacterium]|nr:pirin family protein [Desulfocapsaceae bacterium]
MDSIRKIKKILTGIPTMEGAGVRLKRVFGFSETPLFDPFLLLDDFRSCNPDHYLKGFPWHPHRGIETITYVLQGDVEHGDSLGNAGRISSGAVQWMTAGSGIIHQEMPKGDSNGCMLGFQLWANLPAAEKMMAPRYRDITAADIPEVSLEGGGKIKVICGRVGDVRGPVRDVVIDPQYLDISLPPGTAYEHRTPAGHTVFAYVIDGQGCFTDGGPEVGNETVILFSAGDRVAVRTGAAPVRFLLIAGRPLGEPIAWRGPIVMNTQAELDTAFAEYARGTFIRYVCLVRSDKPA